MIRTRRRIARRPRPAAALGLTRVPATRLAFVMAGLLALAIQCFSVQTHIHIPVRLDGPISAAHDAPAGTDHDKYPLTNDPASCPVCREVAHSGHYLGSPGQALSLPISVSFHLIPFVVRLAQDAAISHTWQGRAPPRI